MNFILNIWLKTVPDYTLVFSKLILYNVMLDVIIGPMITAIQATGRIKTYQIISGLTYLLNLPIAYFFLHKGYPAESVVFSNIIFTLIMGIIRLYFLKSLLGLKLNLYFKNVIIPIIFFLIFLILGIFLIYINFSEGFIRLIITCISSLIFGVISLYTFGINYNERQIINKAIAKIKK